MPPPHPQPWSELDFVQWLMNRPRGRPDLSIGIGDDMALLSLGQGQKLLMSSDMLVEGVHFDLTRDRFRAVGRKALAVCLSDCAAMAVRPVAATLSLAAPDRLSLEDAKELFLGMETLADEYEVILAGGDTARSPSGLVLDVAIVAEPWPGVRPMLRSGGRPGDRLFVTGPLGGSLLDRHTSFTPRVREAHEIARLGGGKVHAMMDLSDGLGLDLRRLCQASRCGASLIEEELLALATPEALEMSRRDGRPVLEHVLEDGEDFELLIAGDPDLPASSPILTPVGWLMEGSELCLKVPAGKDRLLITEGYIHRFGGYSGV